MNRKLILFLIVLLMAGCDALNSSLGPTTQPFEHLIPKVLAVYPHDTSAYTEGLILDQGAFYESAGQYGQSTLRKVDPTTGKILQMTSLDNKYFAEGLALVGNHLIMLSWREQTAFIFDRDTFKVVGTFTYDGEGWGLCYDGQHLYMSNGSSTIFERDPQSFAVTRQFTVTQDGAEVRNLNELECADGALYENVWFTDNILRIDKQTGRVTAVINAAGLLTTEERAKMASDAVLNGIAYDPSAQVFYITGKYWPKLFKVTFVPEP
jgi:glutaminyl-peptide cyclotransferase